MSWRLRNECEHAEVESLARELEVSEVLASVLVRRGHDEPSEARAFLAAELPGHDPSALGDMTRRYGRSPLGTRLVEKTPCGRWQTTTFLGALRAEGFIAPLTVEGAINGPLFRA